MKSQRLGQRRVELGKLDLQFMDDVRLVVRAEGAGVDCVNQLFSLAVSNRQFRRDLFRIRR